MSSVGKIWHRGFRSALANRVAYRGDFFISFSVMLLFQFITPLLTLLMYSRTGGRGFPGWTVEEALLIQAVFMLAQGIANPLFFGMVWTVHGQVRGGTFELTLLRPRSEILICMTRNIDIQSFGTFLAGLGFFIAVLTRLPAPTVTAWLGFLLLFVMSLITLCSFSLIMAATLFVWVGNSRLSELLDSLLRFAQYPGSIFSSFFRTLTAVVIPVGMIALFPSEMLLGRANPLTWFSALAVLAFAGIALIFWKLMVRKYTGAGG